MISIKNLKKSFGDNLIFENVNLEIDKGEAVVIVGGSGCGKSTLLRCINRLNEADCGEIYIDGQDILADKADVDGIRRKMGMVYQQFNLFSHLNVLENVILAPMKILGKSQEQAIKDAEAILDKVGMLNFRYQMPDSLSGGQKQRAAIARALAMNPEIILFDEPTSALDPTMVDEVENVIRRLIDSGITSVIVTHEMKFAKSIGSKIVFLAEQGIYETGTPQEFFDNPKRPLTKEFLYKRRMFEATCDKDTFDPIELRRSMTALIRRYEHTSRQLYKLSVIMDELVYPIITSVKDATASFSLLCSETSTDHVLTIKFTGLDNSPMDSGYLDDINIKIIESTCGEVLASNELVTIQL